MLTRRDKAQAGEGVLLPVHALRDARAREAERIKDQRPRLFGAVDLLVDMRPVAGDAHLGTVGDVLAGGMVMPPGATTALVTPCVRIPQRRSVSVSTLSIFGRRASEA